MNKLCLTSFLLLPLAAQAESLFPMNAGTPYGVPARLDSPPAAPAVPADVSNTLPPTEPTSWVTPLPAPSRDMMVRERSRVSLDMRGFYGFRAVPHSRYATDMLGMEAELAYYVTPRQAITFSAGFGSGGTDSVNLLDGPHGPMPVSEDFTRSDITLMLGYRFTQPLTARTSLSFGLKGGLDIQELSYDDYWGKYHDEGHWEWTHGEHEYVYDDHSYGRKRCGFAYAASVTLETKLTRRGMLQLGYLFRGATTKPDAPSTIPGGPEMAAHTLRWHEVHLGVRFLF